MGYVQAAQIIVGTGALLFLGAVCVSLGLVVGFHLATKWFGAIKVDFVKHHVLVRPSTPEARNG